MSRKIYKQIMEECLIDAVDIQKKVRDRYNATDRIDAVVMPPNSPADVTAIGIELFRANTSEYTSARRVPCELTEV